MRSARLTSAEPPAVVLVAHGSRDPRAALATQALARALPDAYATFLDHAGPRPMDVLASLRPGRTAVLVPLLLTSAYHGRVDVPAVLESARELPLTVHLADVLGAGSPPLLLDALTSRLAAAVVSPLTGHRPSSDFSDLSGFSVDAPVGDTAAATGIVAAQLDGVVLAAAGTRSADAREGIAAVADALGARLGLPCAVAYASASPPVPGEAVERLRVAGARRIGVASYFLAPGLLHDAAISSALASGALTAAAPLQDHPDLVRLIRARIRGALASHLTAAA